MALCPRIYLLIARKSRFPIILRNAATSAIDAKIINNIVEKHQSNLFYNCYIESFRPQVNFKNAKAMNWKADVAEKRQTQQLQSREPIPVFLQSLMKNSVEKISETIPVTCEEAVVNFPYRINTNVGTVSEECANDVKESMPKKIIDENEHWMSSYENFDEDFEKMQEWRGKYGTPDAKAKISNIPCCGCGALLHCKDSSIPGYLPSEIYKNSLGRKSKNLKTTLCQRCFFLNTYNIALQVQIAPDDYVQVLNVIKDKFAMVLLLVDLLDFPCSVWPNIINIIGTKRPVFIVGNKVDLLLQDSKGYLEHIKEVLLGTLQKSCLKSANVQHVALISAKTGFGIEDLISKVNTFWSFRGDVYLIGCTNVGKSSLFNALIQSDFCKVQAVDLMQRATTSVWPGTTLNLLKFPINRSSGWKMYVRMKRLQSQNSLDRAEDRLRQIQLQKTRNPKYATLIGTVDRTFLPEDSADNDAVVVPKRNTNIGLNENDPAFAQSKWCYDTPGVVQPDQVLNLLTTEELMITLPRDFIQPRTFSLRPGSTIFLGGISRLDYISGPSSMRFTIFASQELPVTICDTRAAEDIYNDFLGTELFKVPMGSPERLTEWPELETLGEINLIGTGWDTSCNDVVLSSSGWVSLTCGDGLSFTVKPWTPANRGCYVRKALLPKSVEFRGKRIKYSPAYKNNRFFIQVYKALFGKEK